MVGHFNNITTIKNGVEERILEGYIRGVVRNDTKCMTLLRLFVCSLRLTMSMNM